MESPPVQLDDLVIRPYEPGDEEAIVAAYNRVFSARVSGFRPRTLEEWRWQYLENPAGWRIWLALTPDGRVVNQQAGVPRRVVFDGAVATWNQVVDSFRDPEAGRGLQKPGLFIVAAMPYSDGYGGPPPDRDPVMYGAPSRAAFRIGQRFLEYGIVRSQCRLRLTPDRHGERTAPGSAGVAVEEVAEVPEDVDALFARAAEPYGALTVRDRSYLDWRFARRPGRRYAMALARRGRELVGLAVHRRGTFDGERGSLVCDWLVVPDDAAAGAALRAWLAERAFGSGEEHLTAMFPETCPAWLEFQRAGYRVEAASFFLVARSYVRSHDLRWLYRHWYYTLGDTDLC